MKLQHLIPIPLLLAAACLPPELERAQPARVIEEAKPLPSSPPLPAGSYDVQTVAYDDATGTYRVFVLGAPAGQRPLYEHSDVMLARLTDEAIAAGEKTKIVFTEGAPPALHLTPDFKIEYVHNLTEERVDPRTGQPEVVVVGQQNSTWSPFMSAMTGAMIGNMLFAPRYYYPPPYAAGGLVGYGGMGESRAIASQSYAQRFGSAPKPVKLTQTGMSPRKVDPSSLRSTGSGAGASRLKKGSVPQQPRPRARFGGGRRR